ncbi:MAG: hypothetical protein WDM87_01395 [Terracidiphilus sp.]
MAWNWWKCTKASREPWRGLALNQSLTVRPGLDYRVDHGAFFQVNRWLMNELVECVTHGLGGGLAWDLFAGVGLFARKLAASFGRVVAVDSATAAMAALTENLKGTNGSAVKAATLEFLRGAEKGERPDLIVVDPAAHGIGRGDNGTVGKNWRAAAGVRFVRSGDTGRATCATCWRGLRNRKHDAC